jgi:tetratricopeptide (TPR) repeat protein
MKRPLSKTLAAGASLLCAGVLAAAIYPLVANPQTVSKNPGSAQYRAERQRINEIFRLAMTKLEEGDRRGAREQLFKYLAEDSLGVDAWVLLGFIYYFEGETEIAAMWLKRYFDGDPLVGGTHQDDVEAFALYRDALLKLNRVAEADRVARRIVESFDFGANTWLGRCPDPMVTAKDWEALCVLLVSGYYSPNREGNPFHSKYFPESRDRKDWRAMNEQALALKPGWAYGKATHGNLMVILAKKSDTEQIRQGHALMVGARASAKGDFLNRLEKEIGRAEEKHPFLVADPGKPGS